MPQAPQLFTSVIVFTHVFVPVHRLGDVTFVAHEATHVAPLHARIPFAGIGGHVAHVPGAAPHCSVPAVHA